ncbi:alpha-amylase family protein [Alteromonas sp.]|uniref:alpha-amylase family protein n=1 Tax=Alteromonas sp. TaxID=232 RepID=UPI00257A88FF|nr:alpha-amylase family protein [Alteromonas sp.]
MMPVKNMSSFTISSFRKPFVVAIVVSSLLACSDNDTMSNQQSQGSNPTENGQPSPNKAPSAEAPSTEQLSLVQGKPVVYQLFTRLYGNTNTANIPWGSIEDNGVGKFADINDAALASIKALGTSHVWYTGVPHHAVINDYSGYGISHDDPDVVKGRAGSPYAVKDYYNVNPDLALDPANRLEEFEALIKRTHENGMKVIIDIVPNHVARSYQSLSLPEGQTNFGHSDDTSVVYARDNNFYYVVDKAFEVPTAQGYETLGGDEHPLANGEFKEYPAKWTGNGARAAKPDINDWYETVKINYGVKPDGTYDFPVLPSEYANKSYSEHMNFWKDKSLPDSWYKFQSIAHYWLDKGVDGFRYDMAEMVPVEFWSFLNSSIKQRSPDAFLLAEVYQPSKYRDYIHLGKMDYLYDKVGFYDTLKTIMQGSGKVSELVSVHNQISDIAPHMLHFLENHDEQRIASEDFAGSAEKGKPALAVSALISSSPTLLYFGQDVGEDGSEDMGFGNPTRTTIFDYAGVPAHQRFMNDGKFDAGQSTEEEKALHSFYKDVMNIAATHSAINGRYQSLHALNLSEKDSAYSEKQFAFLREENDQGFIVIANFSDNATGPISLIVPASAIKASSNNLALKPLLSHKGVTLEQEGANYRAIITLDALETKVFAF